MRAPGRRCFRCRWARGSTLRLKTEILASKDKDWSLAQTVSPDQLRYFQRRSGQPITAGIPYLYTVAGYRDVFIKERKVLVNNALKETWVLGPEYGRLQSESEQADLARKVEEAYLTDYIQQWQAFINDIELVPTTNTEAHADLVRAIAQPDSPIKAVLQSIASQTQLARALRAVETETGPAQIGQIGELRQKLESMVGLGAVEGVEKVFDPTERVDRHFEPLNALVRQEGNAPAPIDAALQPFGELYDFLLQARIAPGTGNLSVEGFAGDYARGRAIIARLQASAKGQPEPVARMLGGLASKTQRSTLDPKRMEALQRIVQVWRTSVLPACRSALAGRYPMIRSSTDDANIADFGKVFGPNGLIESFFKQYLQAYADTSVRPWRWTEASAGGLGFTSSSLRMFEDAAKIRQAYFPSGGPQPQVSLTIQPQSLDARARKAELDVGGQAVVNDHGPLTAVPIQWPAAAPTARLAFTPVDNPGQSIAITRGGPWAFFHLLDDAKLESSGSPDRIRAKFDLQGFQATFQLQAESVVNPFALPELQNFQCRDLL
ncbi:MAG: type VI secretion system membrane subunit TssM [Rhodospirillales bacterium]|nr:type VI secretion system membrane subunit TssM [Rhodospirillales bacterium]